MKQSIIIGSRGSDLALWQSNYIKEQLEGFFPETTFEIQIIKTTGDQLQDVALSKIGDKGLFTRQIENALLSREIDFAVHSLKDLQTVQPEGLVIGAVCRRELPNDVLISRKYSSLEELPDGARIATGSLRRRCQLLHHRPDLKIVEIRGNVPTRLAKYSDSDLDGMILAYAGLHRLQLGQQTSHKIPTDLMLPAVGQGAVAVEMREDDPLAAKMAARLNDAATRSCVTAERAFLRRLEGGCQVPIGALCTLEAGNLTLRGLVGSLDGSIVYRETLSGNEQKPDDLGSSLAESLIARGADKLLDEVREQTSQGAGAVL